MTAGLNARPSVRSKVVYQYLAATEALESCYVDSVSPGQLSTLSLLSFSSAANLKKPPGGNSLRFITSPSGFFKLIKQPMSSS
ncbi:MAG: hypothetical protein K8F91_03450 [Candidatus Obscuribacterales bacterium]|nr:hypothetical protein [Candidatus Obscuribacterales bacterium]